MQETFQIPVFVENEANLSVLGEAAFHHKYKNMIHINVHDGIGMGILVNGRLYKGRDGYAGEFGHTILFPDGNHAPAEIRAVLSFMPLKEPFWKLCCPTEERKRYYI